MQKKPVLSQLDFHNQVVNVEYAVLYNQDSTINIQFSILSEELYLSNNKNFKSDFYFVISIYSHDASVLLHSVKTDMYSMFYNVNHKYFTQQIPISYRIVESCKVQIQLYSLTQKLLHSKTLFVVPTSEVPTISVFVKKKGVYTSHFAPYVYSSDTVLFTSSMFDTLSFIYVKHPSLSITPLSVNDSTVEFYAKQRGQYVFYSDSLVSDSLFSFPFVSIHFPHNNTPCLMLEALYIINPKLSIDSLQNTKIGCKIELDKQWLHMTQNNENLAKANIKEFYSRVAQANKVYTFNTEGAQSDRGVCLVLFGKPVSTETSFNREIWYYSSDTLNTEKKIVFTKKNTESKSDFILQKNTIIQLYLDQARANWLQGKPFNL